MQKRSDDRLIAYLDGEVDASERRDIEAWLDSDPAARDRIAGFAESAALVRSAFDEVMHEPVPDRLIAAARGEGGATDAEIVPFKRPQGGARRSAGRGWWYAAPLAASLFGLLLGAVVTYLTMAKVLPGVLTGRQPAIEAAAADNFWLDNAAGYFKLLASAGDGGLIDVPASADPHEALQKISQNLPQGVRLPDLKPWGLSFRGARLVVAEGRPASQLVYNTDNKAIGPLTLIIGSTKEADIPPTLARRQDVNLLYWRHQGRAYALVGQTDTGYLWGIANDVAWQLDAV
jgi:anti-sigma factor RsiW